MAVRGDVGQGYDGTLWNTDLAPVPRERQTWTGYNFLALWVGMAHNVATYLLASGLIALGMNWVQALMTIALGNLIVLVPMLLNSHAGTKYRIPFPVFARASYGVYGANFPALLRAFVACGWFGIQTWIGGQAIYTLVGALSDSWLNAGEIFGRPWTQWLSFLAFWALNMYIIVRGMETLRRFENWAAPLVIVMGLILLGYMIYRADGLGPIVDQPSELGWGGDFLDVFFPSLMAMIAFWATLSLNMPDFTRFAQSQKGQMWGQIAGLPTTMTFFSLLAVLITSATAVVFGEAIWDPVALMARFDNPIVIVVSLFTLGVATLSVNVAANVVSPSNDFSNLSPRLISFRTGGIITGVIGIAIQPWRLLESPEAYIFTWLDFYGGLLGAVGGVLVADYWLVRKARLDADDLYRPHGIYRYVSGWNPIAVVATLVGMLFAVGGAHSEPGKGPFPEDGLIPVLKPLYSYSWVLGFVIALVLYALVMRATGRAESFERDRGLGSRA